MHVYVLCVCACVRVCACIYACLCLSLCAYSSCPHACNIKTYIWDLQKSHVFLKWHYMSIPLKLTLIHAFFALGWKTVFNNFIKTNWSTISKFCTFTKSLTHFIISNNRMITFQDLFKILTKELRFLTDKRQTFWIL